MRYGRYFSIGAENITYDGIDLSEFFDITDAQIQIVPTIDLASTKIPGAAGSHFDSIEYGERRIVLKMSMRAWDRSRIHQAQYWREFNPLLLKDEPKPMQLGESWYINVIISDASELAKLGTRGVADVTFVAHDPYFYGSTREFQLNAGENQLFVENPYGVWPVIELEGFDAGVPLTVTNVDTSETVYIPVAPSSDNTVTIDMQHRRCSSDGQYLMVSPELTSWFSLKGLVTIALSSGHGRLTYRERYL